MSRYVVEFTAKFRTVVECDRKDLENIVQDIEIPESKDVQYVSDSYEVNEVFNEKTKKLVNIEN